jgi:hypothetical protein
MAVSAERSSSLDLRQAAKPLKLHELPDALQLGEVLLELGVGRLGKDLSHERLERRAELAHRGADPLCLEHRGDRTPTRAAKP